jgi:hypothetical protein
MYVRNLCIKHIFYTWIITLAALVCVTFPLLKEKSALNTSSRNNYLRRMQSVDTCCNFENPH